MSAENPRGHFPEVPEEEPRPFAPGPVDLVPPRGASDEEDANDREEDPDDDSRAPRRLPWERNLVLFIATTAAVMYEGRHYARVPDLAGALTFAVPLLVILLCHEFGHWIAARLHRVRASLPYFLPLPYLSPFGTLGAVILMPNRIRTRRALLDIGAAGPLAGLVVAVVVIVIGLQRSPIIEQSTGAYTQEGQSLLYWALKRLIVGPMGPGQDIDTHPIAMAGWAGLFVTFLNLIPFGQSDGGHIAYALLGERQNRIAEWVRFLPLVLAVVAVMRFVAGPALLALAGQTVPRSPANPWSPAFNWLLIFVVFTLVHRYSGSDHPPVDDQELGVGRRVVGWLTMGCFVVLFVPFLLVAY
jgi:membrane-associated protease RseP (regulator of RpoE activity)